MTVPTGHRAAASLFRIAVQPNVAVAQPVDVTALGGLPGYLKAAVSFVLVVLLGGLILHRSEPFVRRSLAALRERPYSAVPYGLMAYVVVLTVGLFGISQLGRAGVASTLVGRLAALLVVGVVASLTAFGFLVVGTLLTDLRGQGRPTHGLLVGAALSAVGWLVLPTAGGLAVWILVAAFGLGGAVRRWFHAERAVEMERAG